MTVDVGGGDFFVQYREALRTFVRSKDEASLAVGHELGRRALSDRMSMLDIIENHSRLVDDMGLSTADDSAAALQFLLQTLAALDVATRGFLDGTRRYEQQRARAEDLADRDEFRDALVNSLQEGFYVADHTGAIVEINDAFVDITGYGHDGLPYRPPYPWVTDESTTNQRLSALREEGSITADTAIRHRDGTVRWVAISINAVTEQRTDYHAYVGTIRDVTATHAVVERERAVARLATAMSLAKDVDEVLSAGLAQSRSRLDTRRLMAVVWPQGEGDPVVHVAGEPMVSNWLDLDEDWRRTFDDARDWLPLTVTPVGAVPTTGTTRGFVAVLSGARDVVVCLEHRVPRAVSAEDRQLAMALFGHISLAMQHVRQLEIARETSLTLQRSLLPVSTLPAGCAVRYEPAVSPLEIGGDFYDVLPVGGNRIGIIVGDCVGRGLSAAAVMGQLRASTRALLLTGAEPAKVLEHLDAVAEFIPDAFCATVFVAIADMNTQTLHYSSAGHVPPVFATGEAYPELLTDGHSVPLAVHRREPRPQATRPMSAGSTLLLYTDGLVERRDRSIDEQIDRVAQVVSDTAELPVDSVADEILTRLAPAAGYDDDVAIVVYRCPPRPLLIDTDAAPRRLSDVRHRVSEWLDANGIGEPLADDIILVVNEASSNCVEHAYRGHDAGRMRIEAEVLGDQVRFCVVDSGSWKVPPADPGTRGRGLLLISKISDEVAVSGTDDGTSVEMTFRLPSDG
ncbi:PAS domain S-box [Mycolicibacterium rhodesiae NBB3]|uniref:PAS domain S-box n=1 Tax=Mycolicibacterium rhodesiae (strain NBB3) TaxID=710685 RepID=G8RK44_MYCRN|nr:SpoIIE family protein phosphatase [Mycolicibacterium rhodesiae]AEV72269.1 PAS domain S-box [Mycolicibacterium rhodesiae NBB3]